MNLNVFTVQVKRSYMQKSRSITIRTFYNSSIIVSSMSSSRRQANKFNRFCIRNFHVSSPVYSPNKIGHARKVLDLVGKHKPLPNARLTPTQTSNVNQKSESTEASLMPKDVSLSKTTIGFLERIIPQMSTTTKLTSPKDHQIGSEVLIRGYAGELYGAYYKSHMKPMSNKIEIPISEKSHLKVYFVADGKIYGVLTSSKFNKKTNENYHFISKEKHDGTLCPATNADGTLNEEGQYFAIFKVPVQVVESNLVGFDKSKQDYLDKYENHIKEILKIHGPKTTNVSLRISKNNSILFNENGTRDSDF